MILYSVFLMHGKSIPINSNIYTKSLTTWVCTAERYLAHFEGHWP